MGFLSSLFGGSKKEPSSKDQYENIVPVQHNGFSIYPCSISENGQYRVAGKIEKTINDELNTHRFIRSDVLPSEQDANELMVSKSKMFIDQMGDKIFQ